jgi:sec-independent protein translocase protein TatA
MGIGSIGTPELIVILLVALLLFGPARLAEIGASLGRAIRDFRKSIHQEDDEP